jgi:hypothetical protein
VEEPTELRRARPVIAPQWLSMVAGGKQRMIMEGYEGADGHDCRQTGTTAPVVHISVIKESHSDVDLDEIVGVLPSVSA